MAEFTMESGKPPGGQAGARPGLERATQDQRHFIMECSPIQAGHADPVAKLIAQAKAQAERCNLLAAACRAAGDERGFANWRKMAARHQAIQWELGKVRP